MTNGARMLLRYRDLGITDVMGGSPPGARASRPHNIGKALPISSTLIDRQRRQGSTSVGPMRFPPAGWPAGRIAGKLSGTQRECMRAGRPRSRGCRPDDAVEDIRRATSLIADGSPLENSRLPATRPPHPTPGRILRD